MAEKDTRYPHTYACDLIRSKGGYGDKGTNLSRSNASQIRQLFSQILNMDDEELAKKLADYYLANEPEITAEGVKEFNQYMEYAKRIKEKDGK